MSKAGTLKGIRTTVTVDDLISYSVLIGVTDKHFPLMLIEAGAEIDPERPETQTITEIFSAMFKTPTWRTATGIALTDIKFPPIYETWDCSLEFYDKNGVHVLPEMNEGESAIVGGQSKMIERFLDEGHTPYWVVCSPLMPIDEEHTPGSLVGTPL